MQDEFLDRRTDPPHGVGRQAETALRIKTCNCLHYADIALGDQFSNREPIAAVTHGNLHHEFEMRTDKPVGRFGILVVAPTTGEHQLFLGRQHGKLADLLKVARKVSFRSEANDG